MRNSNMTKMGKFQSFWESRNTWSSALFYWNCVMFPQRHEKLPESVRSWWDSWWFWQTLNNLDNKIDAEGE